MGERKRDKKEIREGVPTTSQQRYEYYDIHFSRLALFSASIRLVRTDLANELMTVNDNLMIINLMH